MNHNWGKRKLNERNWPNKMFLPSLTMLFSPVEDSIYFSAIPVIVMFLIAPSFVNMSRSVG